MIESQTYRGDYMLTDSYFEQLLRRPRRNRLNPAIRGLVRETRLHPEELVLPLFVREGVDTANLSRVCLGYVD